MPRGHQFRLTTPLLFINVLEKVEDPSENGAVGTSSSHGRQSLVLQWAGAASSQPDSTGDVFCVDKVSSATCALGRKNGPDANILILTVITDK